ncbi:MAG TPA: HupE/UreJ family protein [Rhodobacterales bacterium]|nr:HupE/UreJ family protein [Rhodobacterales bacterium]
MSRLALALLSIAMAALPARAHEVNPSVADVTVSAQSVRFEATINAEAWIAGIDLSSISDTNDAPQAAQYDALRTLEPYVLEDRFRAAFPGLAASFRWQAGDTVLAPVLGSVSALDAMDEALPRQTRIVVTAALPDDDSPVTFAWSPRFGPLILRQMVEDGELPDGVEPYTGFLDGAAASPPLPRVGTAELSALASFAAYVKNGFLHIVPKGLDHILFVLGVFFFALHLRPLMWQVSAFTVAHTLTLALATLGIISISPTIVEPLIAASIAYIGIENIFHRKPTSRIRVGVVFGFGLLHGLGFASVLGNIGLSPGHFIASLVAFNIGVELGQLAILSVAFLAIGLWFGQKPWYRTRVANPISAVIALMGLWWMFERLTN